MPASGGFQSRGEPEPATFRESQSLNPQEDFAILPELFKIIVPALIR